MLSASPSDDTTNSLLMMQNTCDLDNFHVLRGDKGIIDTRKGTLIVCTDLNAQNQNHSLCSITPSEYTDRNASNVTGKWASDESSAKDSSHKFSIPNSSEDQCSNSASGCEGLADAEDGSESSYENDHSDNGHDESEVICGRQDTIGLAQAFAGKCTLIELQSEPDLRISDAENANVYTAASTQKMEHSNFSNKCQPRRTFGEVEKIRCCGSTNQTNCFSKLHNVSPRNRTTICEDKYISHPLQGSLASLLNFNGVVDRVPEKVKDMCVSSQSVSAEVRHEMGEPAADPVDHLLAEKVKSAMAGGLWEELNLASFDLLETTEEIASLERGSQFGSRRQTQQTVAEEMYCKETIKRLIQETHAEIEQWSQMQDLFCILHDELSILSEAKSLWEERAHCAEKRISALQTKICKWKLQARSAQEELVMLRCERRILKNRIEMMEEAQMSMPIDICQRSELRRSSYKNPGRRHEQFGECESFVHSRNASSRSSVDMAALSARSLQKSIKKKDPVSNKENISAQKIEADELEIEPGKTIARAKCFSESANMGSKGEHRNPLTLADFVNLSATNTQSSFKNVQRKEEKMTRRVTHKNKSITTNNRFSEQAGTADMMQALKPRSSMAFSPSSTPSKVLLGNIVNITKH
ncbi:hypothetical protein KP509_24G034500 [Ceratopteris richardii]|uniref:Uncharacterized protein n=1 Tax=Ceratopteris richardii TaxID=49495 RepID=A0A8T2RVF4_CERRI|nr:hypothetical protein KP509_24G034500 [Ceratopteris richardii]